MCPVDLASVTDTKGENGQLAVLNIADNPVIADAILPQIAERRSSKGSTDTAWVVENGDTRVQEGRDAPGNLAIET